MALFTSPYLSTIFPNSESDEGKWVIRHSLLPSRALTSDPHQRDHTNHPLPTSEPVSEGHTPRPPLRIPSDKSRSCT
ncbi:hypothetical protein FA13DRAFT_1723781 [Coprinellus micaceus]|uniref:Uncharacterized protein n=1 Tax=Coprinellus micaceus TaxID=71717 RepID=A0A4Y7TZF9_COPMI|nr:hypothetical protein FA13DRAFT_1723781 [Coprinellus micaceus]